MSHFYLQNLGLSKHLGEIWWFPANDTIQVAEKLVVCLTADPPGSPPKRKGSNSQYLESFRVHKLRRRPMKKRLSSMIYTLSTQVIATSTVSPKLCYVKLLQAITDARNYGNHAAALFLTRDSKATACSELWYKKRVVILSEIENERRSA